MSFNIRSQKPDLSRHQFIIRRGVLLSQALRQKEIVNLKVREVYLEAGAVFIGATRDTNERKLQLRTNTSTGSGPYWS